MRIVMCIQVSTLPSSPTGLARSPMMLETDKKLTSVFVQFLAVLSTTFLIQYSEIHIKNYNFVCCFVWLRNLVTHIEGETHAEDV